MATLDELQQQMEALRQRVDAITAPPTDYYTQRYSGEETDRGVEIALGLDPDGTGIVTPEHGGTGADTPQAALVSLGAGVRPNLMVNSHFVGGGSQQGGGQLPINLRGQTEYAGVTQLISRWKSTNANLESFTIKEDCISLTVGESRAYFRQLTDPGFEWKQGIYTLSALVRGSGSIFLNIAAADAQNSFSGLTAYQLTDQFTICSFSLDTRTISGWDPGQFYMAINAGTTVDIAAMKAEFGEGQTLGYQDSDGNSKLFLQPGSDYATQLLQCQQHAYLLKGSTRLRVNYRSSAALDFTVFLPVPLRTTPTIQPDGFAVYSFPDMQAQTGFTFSIVGGSGSNTATIRATKTGHGLTDAVLYVSGNQILEASL